jgi:hypothetical protein
MAVQPKYLYGFWYVPVSLFAYVPLRSVRPVVKALSCRSEGREISSLVCVSVFRWNLISWETESGALIDLAPSKGPNRVGVSSLHLRMETDPLSETLCFLVFGIPNNRQSPEPR